MSLINEALKRANQAQQTATPAAATPAKTEPQMRPVEHKKSSPMPMLLGIAMVVCLLGGGLLVWKGAQQKPAAVPASITPVVGDAKTAPVAPAPVAPVEAPKAIAAVEPAVSKAVPVVEIPSEKPAVASTAPVKASATEMKPVQSQSVPATAPVEAPEKSRVLAGEPDPNQTVAASTPATPVTTPPVETFPQVKLQGIFYSKSAPSAVVNGKTLLVGGSIKGARVTKIEQDSVTLEWKGETRVLELNQ